MMYTSQFLSRNQNEIMEVFNLYRDLIHDFDWYVLYIDELIKLYNIKKNESLYKIKDLANCD